jgi:putative ABC transport system permease protein
MALRDRLQVVREWADRLGGTVRPRRADHDLEEELRLHIELAADDARRRGETPQQAQRTARLESGGLTQAMDALRDQRGLPWLNAVMSDLVFAWRQLNKHRIASAAAILSLGLAVGASWAAFRLVDAVLLRSLAVADPDTLFVLAWNSTITQGQLEFRDEFDYPTFRRNLETLGDRGDLMVVGLSSRQELRFDDGEEAEPAYRQYFSGNVFPTLGLRPAVGRLLTPNDDVTPRAHPFAVISYDYWTRRFGNDPRILGKTFLLGAQPFEIIGVAPRGFTGTEPGRLTDVFLPATMNWQALDKPGYSWFRMWVRPKAGVARDQIQSILQPEFSRSRREYVKNWPSTTPQHQIDAYLAEQLLLLPAGAGVSVPQRTLRGPLVILAALVLLVLFIACANVANLMTVRAMTRAREMALRLSIGAGRWRLIQLLLLESALLALFASTLGALFAWWAAPFVVSLLALQEPLRLVLDIDWRVATFGVGLTLMVTVLFGLAPALRASSIEPLGALRGGDDTRPHRRLARVVVGLQMAFCVFVLFIAGLFVTTFQRLLHQPLGFASENVLLLETNVRDKQPPRVWAEVGDRLRAMPGVESVALATWAPLSQNRWRLPVLVGARPAEEVSPYFLGISPAFFETMRIGLIAGRDFRLDDTPPRINQRSEPVAGVGIVNVAFARVYFAGGNPVGRQVSVRLGNDVDSPMEIVGLVRDIAYYSVREPMRPTVYLPVEERNQAALVVRAAGDPLALGATLRQEVSRARTDFRVINIATQGDVVSRQMVRERLLATLSLFFAAVALLLAGIGLYGVLNAVVVQKRHEIGIRMALGARPASVIRGVTTDVSIPLAIGAAAGLAAGLVFGGVIESLLFQVKATDPASLATPILTLAVAATLAALQPALRAMRTDPVQTLRAE